MYNYLIQFLEKKKTTERARTGAQNGGGVPAGLNNSGTNQELATSVQNQTLKNEVQRALEKKGFGRIYIGKLKTLNSSVDGQNASQKTSDRSKRKRGNVSAAEDPGATSMSITQYVVRELDDSQYPSSLLLADMVQEVNFLKTLEHPNILKYAGIIILE